MRMNEIMTTIPPLLSGEKLSQTMSVLPEYDPGVLEASGSERLLALSSLYDIYIPAPMSVEVYEKLYMGLMRSLQKKGSRLSVLQQNENYRATRGTESRGIIGGADSFTIIGDSGIGKSSAIERAVSLIQGSRIITVDNPFCKIIPCVTVQCPFDCSVKGLLLEVLRKVDEAIGTRYYEAALHARATTDMLIGSVAQVSLNHIGLLIVDEIQNVVGSRNGRSLMSMLTQLINSSGISICMVGTPECGVFFEQAMQLARRTVGLNYGPLLLDDFFSEVCRVLFSYRYVKHEIRATEKMVTWLYEHTRGILGVLVSLIHDSQELAILSGTEMVNITVLEEVYRKRFAMMHSHLLSNTMPVTAQRKTEYRKVENENSVIEKLKDRAIQKVSEGIPGTIASLVQISKAEKVEMVDLLKTHNLLEEVEV